MTYLYLFYVALGLVSGTTSPVPYGIVVSRWFDRQRGLALALMEFGLGLGANRNFTEPLLNKAVRRQAEVHGTLLFRFVIFVFRGCHRLMPDRLGDTHFAGGQSAAKIEMIDHSVSGGEKVGDLLGLVRRQVKNLHPSACDLNLVIMPVFVPFLQRHLGPR